MFERPPYLFNAHLFRSKGGVNVEVLAQAKRTAVKMPDFRVPTICYGESKALQSHSDAYLSQAIRDKLDDACGQLKAAQTRDPLPFGLIAIDVPRRIISSEGAVFEALKSAMSETLQVCNSFEFVSLSLSGLTIEGDVVSFPQHWKLIHNGHSLKKIAPASEDYLKRIFDGCYRYIGGKLVQGAW